MATIRSTGDRHEIRECRVTERGPRQVALARFRGILTQDVLDEANRAARQPFDRQALMKRARERGIPVSHRRQHDAAHRLIADLRRGHEIDPTLVTLLKDALEMRPAAGLPEHLEEAAEWLGRSEPERGRALRGLLAGGEPSDAKPRCGATDAEGIFSPLLLRARRQRSLIGIGLLLDEQILALEGAFTQADIPHAFGGAQALAYYGSIRATHDIDVNVFLSVDEVDRVFEVLEALGASVENPGLRRMAERDEQVRVIWDATPVDIFFAYDPLHQSSMERRRRVDFYGDPIHVLSAEDLMTYKATFDRSKDWRDIASIVFACEAPLDFDYVRDWLRRIEGPDGVRLARLETIIASGGAELGPSRHFTRETM